MTPADSPLLRADLFLREIDGEVIVYDPHSNRSFVLNLTAAAILELCDGSRSPEQIVSELEAAAGRESGRLADDVASTLHSFRTSGLLEIPSLREALRDAASRSGAATDAVERAP